jgi:glycosyltransferase involved in cell wall biosynthesis
LLQPARGAVGLVDSSESDLDDSAEVTERKPDCRVSIVVDVSKDESMLEATLAGILTLNLRPDGSFPVEEVIVAGGSSSGRPNEIVERFEGHLPVRMVSLEDDADQTVARSAGLEAATSELALFVDSGDVVLPDHLDLLLAEYEPGRVVSARSASWGLAGDDTQSLTSTDDAKTSETVLRAETALESNLLFDRTLVSTERFDAAGLSVLCRVAV